jgi:phosphotransferase system enzyme I (PtsI)
VLDGQGGVVVADPDKATVKRFRDARRQYRARETQLLANRDEPAVTTDGLRIRLEGNVEYLEEIESLIAHGGEGIGLFRTEYRYLRDPGGPDEETEYLEYSTILEEIAPFSATIRTLDIGGDKVDGPIPLDSGAENPALGLRGVRLALREVDTLRNQLRALLRASAHGKLRLLIPFVTGVIELRRVRTIIDEVAAELTEEGIDFDANVPLGAMIEIPSAALLADLMANEVDFFSIGTNDLVQYTLAVDRDNENVANMYTPLHPAVLRLIERTARAARAARVPISICGEMAGEPINVPVLVGCGLDTFSMNPISIPIVKEIIRHCNAVDCRALLQELLTYPTVDEVQQRLERYHRERFGELAEVVLGPE